MSFFNLPKPIYYLPIIFYDNNQKNDFSLCLKLTQSNGPLSTNQTINHFIIHSANQIDKVQFDYLVALNVAKTSCPN